MGSRTTLAFEAKRYSEAPRFVSLIMGRVSLPDGRGAGRATRTSVKLAACIASSVARGERDAVWILSRWTYFQRPFSIASGQVVVFGVRFDRTKPIGRLTADRKLKDRCSLTGGEKCH